ncbi:MAG: DUF3696 domain-containing protein [Desulfobacterales bacterium]|nr:DUF3696 domain-containing protein [Desulfobacterales bacterium]
MIRHLRLNNFKCFADQQVELGPLNLLSGLNNAGKSSLIHSLLVLRQSYQQGLLQKTGLALNGELIHTGEPRDALHEAAEEDKIGFELTTDNDVSGKWLFDYDRKSDVLNLSASPDSDEIYSANLFQDNFQHLGSERIGPGTYFKRSDAWVVRRRQIGPGGQYAIHYLSEFKNKLIVEDILGHPKEESRYLGDQVEAWMGEISPGVRLHIQSHKKMDLLNLEYSFAAGAHVSNRFRTTNTGHGITAVLPILIALLSARKDSLIILENPEAYLHPMGQIRIGELIALAAKCGAQVIVETHGDHLLNGIRLSVYEKIIDPGIVRLLFFGRIEKEKRGRIVIHPSKIDESGGIEQWPLGFFDTWDTSLKELLNPRSK